MGWRGTKLNNSDKGHVLHVSQIFKKVQFLPSNMGSHTTSSLVEQTEQTSVFSQSQGVFAVWCRLADLGQTCELVGWAGGGHGERHNNC